MQEEQIEKGMYTHYKNKDYEVIGEGRHESTGERFVVYRALYESDDFDNSIFWLRPKEDFLATVDVDGKQVPRFKKKD